MAAYNAGQSRRSTVGPTTRVPIADFLVSNGYVPPTAARAAQNKSQSQGLHAADANKSLTSRPVNTHLGNGCPSTARAASIADMLGVNGMAPRSSMELTYQESPSILSHNHHQATGNVSMGIRSATSPQDIKPVCTPGPFSNMTPEPGLMPSIESDGTEDGQVAALRNEVFQLRNVFQTIVANGNLMSNHGMFDARARPGTDDEWAHGLHQRVSQLEGMVHAIQNASLTTIDERVVSLEKIIEQLKEKVGNGCDAEVAKMREVFGSLREAMTRVGNFL